jgi:predicted enzyme involved in methoxymalonyl-ACP biosynthesis
MGRGLEEAAFGEMARMARERGLSALRGLYIPTAKNPMVKDLYPRLGFASLGDGSDGAARWGFDLRQNDVPPARYIKVVFRGANEPPR